MSSLRLALPLALACAALGARAGQAEDPVPGTAAEAPASAESVLAAQTPGVVKELREKAVVIIHTAEGEDEESGRFIRALVVFEKPPGRVFGLLTQTARQAEYQPDLRSVEPQESFPNGNVEQHRLRIAFLNVVYHVRHEWDPERRRLSWNLDPEYDNDVRHVEGFWELYALDEGRTLGRYGTKIDLGRLFPGFIQRRLTRSNLPAAMERVRLWVDSDGTYRKP